MLPLLCHTHLQMTVTLGFKETAPVRSCDPQYMEWLTNLFVSYLHVPAEVSNFPPVYIIM